MNIKGKLLNLPRYCVFKQNEDGRCRNRDIGKVKSKMDCTNPHKIFFPNFLILFSIFPTLPCAGAWFARADQCVPATRRSSSPAIANRQN